MTYEVSESRFFEVLNIKEILEYKGQIIKIQQDDKIAYYSLNVDFSYLNSSDLKVNDTISFPIEFNIRDSEELDVILNQIFMNVLEDKGVELSFDINVNITLEEEIIEPETIEKAEIIKEALPIEIPDEFEEESDVLIVEEDCDVMEVVIKNDTNCNMFDLNNILKNSYQKFIIIPLNDESTFDKISSKYNIKIEELFRLKKEGLKVIVCAKE